MIRYIIIVIIFCSCNSNNESVETTSPVYVDRDSITNATDDMIGQIDSVRLIINNKISEIKRYNALKKDYEQQVQVYAYAPNDTEAAKLRIKLRDANTEIARLNTELNTLRTQETATKYYPVATRKRDTIYIQPEIITPDDKSLVVDLDGKSAEGITIYLIPFSKRIKKLMVYEATCDESIILKNDYRVAKYYNGVYFFNSVVPGKYLIKICTYYGNYMVVTKSDGKEVVKMEVAPPVQ